MDVRADGLLPLFERHKPEVVFHLAAQAGVRRRSTIPMLDASVNLMGTLNVVECAIKVGARKVIYAASGGTIYGEPRRIPAKETAAQSSHPLTPYGISKRLPWTTSASTSGTGGWTTRRARSPTSTGRARILTARPAWSRSSPRRCLRAETPTIYGDGNQTRDYVFIDDVVHAFVQAIDRGSGKLVNIGTGP